MKDHMDLKIIRRVQEDFPLTAAPYRMMAEEIGISESELLERLRCMKESGVLRKLGAVLQHREAGFHGNALCCWRVPAGRVAGIAEQMAAIPYISHVYLRQPHEKWPYNLFTVFHSHTREECLERIVSMANDIEITEFQVLFSRRNWKRSRLRLLQETV